MIFKTKRSSETGIKLQVFVDKMRRGMDAIADLQKQYGWKAAAPEIMCINTGIAFVLFDDPSMADPSIWREKDGRYYPKKTTKGGRQLAEMFANLPMVTGQELNKIVNAEIGNINHVGLKIQNMEFFVYDLQDDPFHVPPKDCEEITLCAALKLCPDGWTI